MEADALHSLLLMIVENLRFIAIPKKKKKKFNGRFLVEGEKNFLEFRESTPHDILTLHFNIYDDVYLSPIFSLYLFFSYFYFLFVLLFYCVLL